MAQFNFPSDILQALDALNTLNSGSVEPPATAPYMLWMDTGAAPAVLKQRNGDDTGWNVLLTASNTSFDDSTAQLGASDVQAAIEKIKQSLDTILNKPADVPVGSINALAVSTVPAGWLECDGAAVSRTEFAALFALLGTKFGAGDGFSTFNLPDLRGEFIRGWDNGRGVDADRVLGTSQLAGVGEHDHSLLVNMSTWDGGGGHGGYAYNYSVGSNHFRGLTGVNQAIHGYSDTVGGAGDYAGQPLVKMAQADAETRPRNVALMYVIKY
ncbi:phage tail protein [Salidesulfovibrio onnuriiensis]|uniref:phage tail protein n=1 Tax=Salidesulfovibrio onnuriiensis TaxID=2583823 RepID=UPI0011C75B7F|nr:phage tail protein [Salidesulfovibrio onnuriiensis]